MRRNEAGGAPREGKTGRGPAWPFILGGGWILAVALIWLHRHWVWTEGGRAVPIQLGALWHLDAFGRALAPILAIFLAAGTWAATRRFLLGKRWEEPICLGIPAFVAVFFLAVLAVLNVTGFLRADPATGLPPLEAETWPLANAFFAVRLSLLVLTVTLFILAAHAAGAIALRWLNRLPDDPLDAFLFRVAAGLGALALALFGLGAAGAYRWEAILVLLTVVFASALRETTGLLRRAATARWTFVLRGRGLPLVVFLFLLAMAALNAADLLRPIPVGYDDLNRYLLRPRLMAESHALVAGVLPFPVELLTGLGFLFSGSSAPAMAISWSGGVLTVLAVLGFARRFWTLREGVVAAAVFYTLPMVGQLSDFDLKIDLMFCFVAVMAWRALAERAEGAAPPAWLALAAGLAGTALAMKLTAVFLLGALTAGAAIRWPRVRPPRGRALAVWSAAAGLFLLSVAPWFLYNVSTRGWRRPSSAVEWITSRAPAELRDADWRAAGLSPGGGPAATGIGEEMERYEAPNRGWRRFLLPWNLSMNVGLNDLFVGIGYLFLAFLPVSLLLHRWRDWSRHARWLTVTALVYWVAWAAGGMCIPWYALPGFVPLALGVALFLGETGRPRWFGALAAAAAVVSLGAHVMLQADKACPPVVLRYAAGDLTPDDFTDEVIPGARQAAEILDASPAPTRVLRIGTLVPYFVRDAHRRMVEDSYLDLFNRLDAGASDAVTLRRLRAVGIRHVLFDLRVNSIEADVGGTLHRKANRFVSFANRNLLLRFQDPRSGIALLEVPPAPFPTP
ncbi:MAG: hypothetical protein KA419_11500 [Acidobacteria bacterium]|nr:hypothetical protein [Acidobacteriota bacterium]